MGGHFGEQPVTTGLERNARVGQQQLVNRFERRGHALVKEFPGDVFADISRLHHDDDLGLLPSPLVVGNVLFSEEVQHPLSVLVPRPPAGTTEAAKENQHHHDDERPCATRVPGLLTPLDGWRVIE